MTSVHFHTDRRPPAAWLASLMLAAALASVPALAAPSASSKAPTDRAPDVDTGGSAATAAEPAADRQKSARAKVGTIDIAKLQKSDGILLNYHAPNDWIFMGNKASGVGDVNGDGYDDVALSAGDADDQYGVVTVAFGGARKTLPRTIELSLLDGRDGFMVLANEQRVDNPIGGRGDIDADGYDDIVVGHENDASVWITYGRSKFPAEVLYGEDPDGKKALLVTSPEKDSTFPNSVAIIGDMNGDGFDDFAMGDANALTEGGRTGATYVVFGRKRGGGPGKLSIRDLNGRNGFRIVGGAVGEAAGSLVAPAGDFNGDGLADLLVGAPYAKPGGRKIGGRLYVVFGRTGRFPAELRLAELDGRTGFAIPGVLPGDELGRLGSATTAGDVNGDEADDIVLSAAESPSSNFARASFVVFGQKRASFAKSLDLRKLNAKSGFRVRPSDVAVSGVGDVNSDGFADVLFSGGYDPKKNGYLLLGQAQFPKDIVFGETPSISYVRVKNRESAGPVSPAGDFDGDGWPDMLLGSPGLPTGGGYVLFGQDWK